MYYIYNYNQLYIYNEAENFLESMFHTWEARSCELKEKVDRCNMLRSLRVLSLVYWRYLLIFCWVVCWRNLPLLSAILGWQRSFLWHRGSLTHTRKLAGFTKSTLLMKPCILKSPIFLETDFRHLWGWISTEVGGDSQKHPFLKWPNTSEQTSDWWNTGKKIRGHPRSPSPITTGGFGMFTKPNS